MPRWPTAWTGGDHLCLAGAGGRRLATYGWFALRRVDADICDSIALTLPPRAAYFYNGFTRPSIAAGGSTWH